MFFCFFIFLFFYHFASLDVAVIFQDMTASNIGENELLAEVSSILEACILQDINQLWISQNNSNEINIFRYDCVLCAFQTTHCKPFCIHVVTLFVFYLSRLENEICSATCQPFIVCRLPRTMSPLNAWLMIVSAACSFLSLLV